MSLNSLITVLFSLLFFKVAYSMDLNEYRWKSRPLVISQDSQGLWQKQQKALDQAELKEREVVVLFEKSQSFQVILYGKDGLKKLESKTVVTQDELNELIDSMPMRQSEMRRSQ